MGLERVATVEHVDEAFRQAASSSETGVIDVTDELLVSGDFHGDSHSARLR
jgi:glyceraldehyde 3-phosphate dehydrogenase